MEFLEAYAEAVRTRDRKFLTLHTRFPLPVVVLEYSMDLHHVERTLHRPDELEPEIVGLSDDRFLAQLAKRPHPLRRGVSNLPGPPDSGLEYYTDYSEGEPAIDIHGARVTVTVTADGIGVMSHATELDFSNEGGVLRLTALKMQ